MKNPEPLMNNAALRALVQHVPFPQARGLLRRGLLPLVIPPRRMRKLVGVVDAHMARFLPELDAAERRRRVEAFAWHYGCKFAEDGVCLNVANIDRWIAILGRYLVQEGAEHAHAAVAHGRGVLAVGSHVGAPVLGTLGLLYQFYHLPRDRYPRARLCAEPEVRRYPGLLANEEEVLRDIGADVRFILTQRESRDIASDIAAMLGEGMLVTTNLDVVEGGGSQMALPLFGGRAHLRLPALVGAAKVALRAGAVVLPWRCLRERRRLRLQVSEPIGPLPRLGPEATEDHPEVLALVERLRAILDDWIRTAPEQWCYWDRFAKRVVRQDVPEDAEGRT